MDTSTPKPPITNCHVHIFTAEHVPAYLARTILPWPLYKWVDLHWVVRFMKWMKRRREKVYEPPLRDLLVARGRFINALHHSGSWVIVSLIRWWLIFLGVYYTYRLFVPPPLSKCGVNGLEQVIRSCEHYHFLFPIRSTFLKLVALLGIILLVPISRRFIWPVLVAFNGFLGRIPSKHVKELWERYKLIVNYTLYGVGAKSSVKQSGQRFVFRTLKAQYPAGTRFVILPMDMEFMDAGPVGPYGGYHQQMKEIQQLLTSKDYQQQVAPFIHVDPRRVAEENNHASVHYQGKPFFSWNQPAALNGGRIELLDCMVKDWLDAGFRGFKIYPALGYYPFDEELLPVWAYAAQEGLPIMTHCIRGVIYYRGDKKREWNAHPVLKRVNGTEQLELLQVKNVEFQENFTHPLNYLCMLAPALLAETIQTSQNVALRSLFFAGDGHQVRDLSALKICFAHFGGDDEWRRHLEGETDVMMQQLGLHPTIGLNFKKAVAQGAIGWNALESYWRRADWYSIICSMMLQYPNVYADISYILHDEVIRPLLKRTLDHPILRERVLFGTDFYVVRNHKSDTELLAGIQAGLTTAEFDLIARSNPLNYL